MQHTDKLDQGVEDNEWDSDAFEDFQNDLDSSKNKDYN